MPAGDNLQVVDAIYDAGLDADRWPRVLERMTQAFGCASAHLSVEDPASTHGSLVSFGTDPVWARRYADYYVTCNVLWDRAVRRSLDGILTDRMIMPKDEVRRSEFYNDFLRPQGGDELLCSLGLQRNDLATNLTLWRPERLGPWERKDMKALAGITPHLRRAVEVNQKLGELRLVRDLATDALDRLDYGVVLLTEQARIQFANRTAEALFADGVGLHVERQQLAACKGSDTAALHRMVAEAAQNGTGGSLVISRGERPPLFALAMPMKANRCLLAQAGGAIVFIKDAERPAQRFLAGFTQHFGLTPAQAALAQELMKGDGVIAAAARLGISSNTARTHLIHIFQKTATGRQAELVRLMLDWSEWPVSGEAHIFE